MVRYDSPYGSPNRQLIIQNLLPKTPFSLLPTPALDPPYAFPTPPSSNGYLPRILPRILSRIPARIARDWPRSTWLCPHGLCPACTCPRSRAARAIAPDHRRTIELPGHLPRSRCAGVFREAHRRTVGRQTRSRRTDPRTTYPLVLGRLQRKNEPAASCPRRSANRYHHDRWNPQRRMRRQRSPHGPCPRCGPGCQARLAREHRAGLPTELQRRRKPTGRAHAPTGPRRPRAGDGNSRKCVRTRSQPRLRQTRYPRSSIAGPLARCLECRCADRCSHDQRLAPSLRHDLRTAAQPSHRSRYVGLVAKGVHARRLRQNAATRYPGLSLRQLQPRSHGLGKLRL